MKSSTPFLHSSWRICISYFLHLLPLLVHDAHSLAETLPQRHFLGKCRVQYFPFRAGRSHSLQSITKKICLLWQYMKVQNINSDLTRNIHTLRQSLRTLHKSLSSEKDQQKLVQADGHLQSMVKYVNQISSPK